jgi:hypothetical protein
VSALCALRELLDSQPFVVTTTTVTNHGESPRSGGNDARPSRASPAAEDAGVRAPRTVAEAL